MKYWQPCAVLLIGAGVLSFGSASRLCCGARQKPSTVETAIARGLLNFFIPSAARHQANPFRSSPHLLEEAAHHFADHCASCHGNDGSGQTPMGQSFSPPVPDMRLAATQQLSDGELDWIIHNGVRWTGMPAWGDSDSDPDSWKLVLFIRHLPQLSAAEQHDMERFNPVSRAELEEEVAERNFLSGSSPTPKHSSGEKR